MGRKTRMPRLPPILGKGAAHKDRRREALIYEQTKEIADEIDRRILADLIPGSVDNPNEQEDNDA